MTKRGGPLTKKSWLRLAPSENAVKVQTIWVPKGKQKLKGKGNGIMNGATVRVLLPRGRARAPNAYPELNELSSSQLPSWQDKAQMASLSYHSIYAGAMPDAPAAFVFGGEVGAPLMELLQVCDMGAYIPSLAKDGCTSVAQSRPFDLLASFGGPVLSILSLTSKG